MMSKKLRMVYYLPGQSELFSEPYVFETQDGKEWGMAVNIVRVERIK